MIRTSRLATFALLIVTLSASGAASGAAKSAAAKPATQPPGKISDPAVAAKRLYAAWQKHDRKAARAVASSAAVSKLFSARFHTLAFQGCERGDEGFQCVYHDAKEGLYDVAFTVEGGASAGYGVTSVSFSSEE